MVRNEQQIEKQHAPPERDAAQLGNRHLIVFLWAMCSVLHPTSPQIKAVRDEIHSVLDSLRARRLRESDIVAALAEEENILTDWARRDRR